MAELADDAVYIGSRLIVLTTMEPEDAAEGLLVVYQKENAPELETKGQGVTDKREKDPQGVLRVRVGTNNAAYSGEIDWARVKLADKMKLSTYLLTDGSLHPDITIRMEHDIGPALRLIVQERVASSGMMKFAYVGKLDKDTGSSPVLHFCNSLSQAVNTCGDRISRLEKELVNAKKSAQNWKDTAESLDMQVWKQEKDRLVNNFVTLWNERQRRVKEQFRELKEELEATKAALESKPLSGTAKRPRALQMQEEMAADDLAATKEPVPLEEVAALAAGKRVKDTTASLHRRKPIMKAGDTVSAATLKQQAESYRKSRGGKRKVVSEPGDDPVHAAPPVDSDEVEGRVPRPKRRRRAKIQPPPMPKDDASASSHDSEMEAFRAQIRARVQETRSSSVSMPSSETDDGKNGEPVDDQQSDASF